MMLMPCEEQHTQFKNMQKICTLFVSVNVISTKLLSEGTIFTFPTRDAGHRSHAKF